MRHLYCPYLRAGLCALALAVAGCPSNQSNSDGGHQCSTAGDTPDLAMPGGGDDGGALSGDVEPYCPIDIDGGPPAPEDQVDGGPNCPADKRLPGCPCPFNNLQDNQTPYPCWPGLRKNRHVGQCMDGVTYCEPNMDPTGRLVYLWGQCVDAVLPNPKALPGFESCDCVGIGTWRLENLSPCFYDIGGGLGSGGAASSASVDRVVSCPLSLPLSAPREPWSEDSFATDCAGHYTLCYTLKAGDPDKPSASDCTVARVCIEADYGVAGVYQPFPPLPGWVAGSDAHTCCAIQFAATGGYGEMSVEGRTVLNCQRVSKVFDNRVRYCPASCGSNPQDPSCQHCYDGAITGNF
jgi:hypothetical protein